MTSGLLQRLAEQTLGLAQPLRSQLAMSGSGARPQQRTVPPESIEQPAQQPGALPPQGELGEPAEHSRVTVLQTEAPPQLVKQSRSDWQAEAPPPRRTAPAATITARPLAQAVAAVLPAASGQRGEQSVEPAAPVSAVPSRTGLLALDTAPQPEAARERPSAWHEPVALLPEQPAPRVAVPRHPASRRERIEARVMQAAAAQPTEVHISIGRIELSALAPPPSTARPTAREREAGRSLADYLRPGNKGRT